MPYAPKTNDTERITSENKKKKNNDKINERILYSCCAIKLSQSTKKNVDFLFGEFETRRHQCEIDWLGSLAVIISSKLHLGSTKHGFDFVFVYSNIWFIESKFGMFSVIVHYVWCALFLVLFWLLFTLNRTMFHNGVNYHGNSIRTSEHIIEWSTHLIQVPCSMVCNWTGHTGCHSVVNFESEFEILAGVGRW